MRQNFTAEIKTTSRFEIGLVVLKAPVDVMKKALMIEMHLKGWGGAMYSIQLILQ